MNNFLCNCCDKESLPCCNFECYKSFIIFLSIALALIVIPIVVYFIYKNSLSHCVFNKKIFPQKKWLKIIDKNNLKNKQKEYVKYIVPKLKELMINIPDEIYKELDKDVYNEMYREIHDEIYKKIYKDICNGIKEDSDSEKK